MELVHDWCLFSDLHLQCLSLILQINMVQKCYLNLHYPVDIDLTAYSESCSGLFEHTLHMWRIYSDQMGLLGLLYLVQSQLAVCSYGFKFESRIMIQLYLFYRYPLPTKQMKWVLVCLNELVKRFLAIQLQTKMTSYVDNFGCYYPALLP